MNCNNCGLFSLSTQCVCGEIQCPGCDVPIDVDTVGGYRTFCRKCVDSMPPFPTDGKGHLIYGRYPEFKWD